MAHQQARRTGAEALRGEDVVALAQGQHFATHDTRVAGPAHGSQRDCEIDQTRSENGSQRDREQDSRKRQHDVHAAHYEVVDWTARQRGGRPNQTADDERDRDDYGGNRERKARAKYYAGQHVTAEGVATEWMRSAGAGENVGQIDRQRIGSKQNRTKDRAGDNSYNDSHSNSQ